MARFAKPPPGPDPAFPADPKHGQKDYIQPAPCVHLGQTPCLKNSAEGILSKKSRFGVDISRKKCECMELKSCTGNQALEAAGGCCVDTNTGIQVNFKHLTSGLR